MMTCLEIDTACPGNEGTDFGEIAVRSTSESSFMHFVEYISCHSCVDITPERSNNECCALVRKESREGTGSIEEVGSSE